MSETVQTPEVAQDSPQNGVEQSKVYDADYVAALRKEAAKYRTEAKSNADAATRLAEIEESTKSEAQRAAERLAEAERKATEAESRALRREVALAHKLTPEDAALLDTITDEDAMRKLAERLAGEADRNRKGALGPYVPQEGNVPNVPLNGDPLLDALKSKLGIA